MAPGDTDLRVLVDLHADVARRLDAEQGVDGLAGAGEAEDLLQHLLQVVRAVERAVPEGLLEVVDLLHRDGLGGEQLRSLLQAHPLRQQDLLAGVVGDAGLFREGSTAEATEVGQGLQDSGLGVLVTELLVLLSRTHL